MLDVQRGVDVDAGGEQVLDILVALLMPAAGDVGMGKLVDQRELGLALQDRVDVHLAEIAAAIEDLLARDDLKAARKRLGLSAAVCLHNPDPHIHVLAEMRLGRLKHRESLADTGIGAEKDFQLSPSFAFGFFEEVFRCRAFVCLRHCRHWGEKRRPLLRPAQG